MMTVSLVQLDFKIPIHWIITYPVDSTIWPVLGVQMVECGVKESKSGGKNKEGEWGMGVNPFVLTPDPTPSLFILLTSLCAIHTI